MKEVVSASPNIKLDWSGIFDFNELYKNMKEWLNYQGFGNDKKTFQEKKYVERIKGESKQIEINWKSQKNMGDYFAYIINVTFMVVGLKDVEIQQGERKIKSQSGDININIKAELVKDRNDNMKTKIIQNLYEKFIIKEKIDNHKVELYSKTYSFHDEIKAYLNMH